MALKFLSKGPEGQQSTSNDPFNWPSLNRKDLMNLQTLGAEKDLVRVKTAHVDNSRRSREASKNLETHDIQGIHIQSLSVIHFRGTAKKVGQRN
jgi:hypothetical protein